MSAARQYEPRGYAKAAVAHLRQQPPGTLVPTAALAEVLACDARQLSALLEAALKYGALRAEPDPADKRRRLWALGDGNPVETEENDAPLSAAPEIQPAVRPVNTWPFVGTAAAAEPEPAAAAARAAPPPPELRLIGKASTPMRCALWSDGELQITRGAARFDLSAEETRQLVAYLERLTDRNEQQATA